MAAPISAKELVDAVIDALGIRPTEERHHGATALTEALRWPPRGPGRIRKWREGGPTLPDYNETWDMLATLGLVPSDRAAALELLARIARERLHPDQRQE